MIRIENINFLELLQKPALLFPLILCLGYYVGNQVIYPDPYIWLLLISAIPMYIALKNNKFAIFIVVGSIFFLRFFFSYMPIIPRQIYWIEDAIILMLLAKVSLLLVQKKRIEMPKISVLILVMLGIAIVSSLINGLNPVLTALGIRQNLKYFLLFILLTNLNLSEDLLKKIIWWLLLIALVQVPVAIVQRIFFDFFQSNFNIYRYNFWDAVSGTLGHGSSGALAVFMLFVILLLRGLAKHSKSSQKYNLISLMLLIPFFLTFSRGGYYLLIVLVVYELFFGVNYGKLRVKKSSRILSSVLLIIILLIGLKISSMVMIYDLNKFLSPSRLYQDNWKGGRLSALETASNFLGNKGVSGALLGGGVGYFTETSFTSYATIDLTFGSGSPSRLIGTASYYSIVMGELGYLGLILSLLMIYILYKMTAKFYSRINDKYWKAIAYGFKGVILLTIPAMMYLKVWISPSLGFTFWFLASAIYIVGKKKNILA